MYYHIEIWWILTSFIVKSCVFECYCAMMVLRTAFQHACNLIRTWIQCMHFRLYFKQCHFVMCTLYPEARGIAFLQVLRPYHVTSAIKRYATDKNLPTARVNIMSWSQNTPKSLIEANQILSRHLHVRPDLYRAAAHRWGEWFGQESVCVVGIHYRGNDKVRNIVIEVCRFAQRVWFSRSVPKLPRRFLSVGTWTKLVSYCTLFGS